MPQVWQDRSFFLCVCRSETCKRHRAGHHRDSTSSRRRLRPWRWHGGRKRGPSVAAPAVTMTLLGSDMADSVCSFQFLQNGAVDQGPAEDLISQHDAMTGHAVPDSWILLDDQSTVDVFCNKNLLQNIPEGKTICGISCNAGTAETNLIPDLPGCPSPVWFHPKGIANALSLHRVSQHC
jgi:hypothetical protein